MDKVDKGVTGYMDAFNGVSILAGIAIMSVGAYLFNDNRTDLSILLVCQPIWWVMQGCVGCATRYYQRREMLYAWVGMVTLSMQFLLGCCISFAAYRLPTLDKTLSLDTRGLFFYKGYSFFRDHTKATAVISGICACLHALTLLSIGYFITRYENMVIGTYSSEYVPRDKPFGISLANLDNRDVAANKYALPPQVTPNLAVVAKHPQHKHVHNNRDASNNNNDVVYV